ncbi:hypothetical protein [Paenibacillus anseongense]|uniref:hypothetical protein n=1 Tax=Paenibacillus anseongense TaxID=2682845 RepID=UPI002DB78D14|nr:hypothetical protein [Paenibacillus anseongense]MEC0269342.1 hypothetical protein [Paenibacillus anseongense]
MVMVIIVVVMMTMTMIVMMIVVMTINIMIRRTIIKEIRAMIVVLGRTTSSILIAKHAN